MKLDEATLRKMLDDAGVPAEVMQDVRADSSLTEAGVDSLDFANILLAIEEKLGVKIPDEEALELDSIRSLVDYVNRKLG